MFENFPNPVLFAHRGASAHAPENTLPAFELALQQGADGVELDVKLTADGHVIVMHDATVDRTTDGHGRVRDLTLADFRKLDAGSYYSEAYRGTKVPTLDEVFAAIGPRCVINVELTNYTTPRDALVEKVCALVERHALQGRILFSSFFAGNLRKAASLLPSVPRGLLALDGWKGAWARSFGFMFGEFQSLHPYITDVNAPQVSRVHRLKRRIHVWTANSVEEVTRLKNWGVDGIFTDDPQTAVRALGRGRG
ncbi:MAG: glycerophosphodiester phosphodiesterase [Chloroflexi bacterium]|nr:glycerophosphodiester phosphodiesterase [Chloroflexota bacterium]